MKNSEILHLANQWGISTDIIMNLLENRDSLAYRFLRAVQIGSKHAIHSKELQKKLSVGHRDIEDAAFRLRGIGFPIIGNSAGYYAAADLTEGKECFELLYNRAMSTLHSLERIHETLEKEGCV